ncbi:hypothetical protein L2E82_15574 [Cichorium intybus]|uniref:Uncharacterized protein n=1 Tax=Cichorium intybus TaxID=13427 RepID=A0ACB9F4F9_CICIN|nr:hypothetical protein L2E82_15574 [Cichorium intybus]
MWTRLWEKDSEILSQITPQQFGIAADDDNNDVNMTSMETTLKLKSWLVHGWCRTRNQSVHMAEDLVLEALDEEQEVDDGVGDGASCDGFGGLYTGEFHRKTGYGRVVASDFRK